MPIPDGVYDSARGSPALEVGVAPLHEGGHALGESAVASTSSWEKPSSSKLCLAARLEARLTSHLVSVTALLGAAARRLGPLVGEPSSSAAGTTRLTRPSRSASAAGQVVAEEHDLLRLRAARRGAAAGSSHRRRA